MTVGPLADYKGYKALWHPYNGAALPYRLLYPKNYDSSQSYPLIITIGGGAGFVGWPWNGPNHNIFSHTGSGGENLRQIDEAYERFWDPDNTDSVYHQHDAFVLCPDISHDNAWDLDYAMSNGDDKKHPEAWCNEFGLRFAAKYAISDLVRSLIDESVAWYEDSDTVNTRSMDTVHIDSARVYAAGFSMGGGMVFDLIQEMRDVLAGAVMMAGWPIGRSGYDYYRVASDDYDPLLSIRLGKQIDRISHIPLLVVGGSTDTTVPWDVQAGLLQAYIDGAASSSIYAVQYSGGHSSAMIDSVFKDNQYFDSATPGQVQMFGTANGSGKIRGVDWLFSLRKPTTPTDPYPDLHADGWRNYGDTHFILWGDESSDPLGGDPFVSYLFSAVENRYAVLALPSDLGSSRMVYIVYDSQTGQYRSRDLLDDTVYSGTLSANQSSQAAANFRLRNRSNQRLELWGPKKYLVL